MNAPAHVPPAANGVALPPLPPDFATTLYTAAQEYEQHGWQLAPLRTYMRDGEIRQHPPKGWPTRTGTVTGELYDGSQRLARGLALLLGPSGVADIDLDSDIARELAPSFLRATAMFGRKGRVTHYLYAVPALPHPEKGGPPTQTKTRAFKLPGTRGESDKATLLELRRGPGAQTTVPPTIKPDGYPAVWMSSTLPVAWEPEDEQRVEDLALACVLALSTWEPGKHDSALQFAGELARRGVDIDRALHVVEVACTHRGDDNVADRIACVHDTYARRASGEAVAGVPDGDIHKLLDTIVERAPRTGARVNISAPLDAVIDAIGAALQAAAEPRLFSNGGGLVTLEGPATAPRLAVEVARVSHFVRSGKDGDVIVHPSIELMSKLAASPPQLPELLGQRTTPILRRDGSVYVAEGYDAITRTWCHGDVCTPIDHDPCSAARRLLEFVYAGQFEDQIDTKAWLAHVLTVAARPAIDGCVPAWIYTSPVPGGGKTTLARVAGVLGGGCADYTAPDVRDEDELARRLDAFALQPAVVLDNMRGVLRSTILEGAVTNGVLPVRRLYVGPVHVPWRVVLSVTSNGAEVGHDWARRSLPVRLTGRTMNASRDVLAEAKKRDDLQADAITIVSAWLRSGLESAATPLASFAEWSSVVAGAIAWIGLGDIVAETRDAASELVATTDDNGDLLDAIERWLAKEGKSEFSAAELWGSPVMAERREGFRDLAALTSRLKRCGDATRVLTTRKTKGVRQWRIERR